MTVTHGADVAGLRALADAFDRQAKRLEGVSNATTATVRQLAWQGNTAIRFGEHWDRVSVPSMRGVIDALHDAASRLRHEADQQERASAPDVTGIVGRGPVSAPAGGWQWPGALAWAGLLSSIGGVIDKGSGLYEAIGQMRNIRLTNDLLRALQLGTMSARDLVSTFGGKIPWAGSALGVADMLLAWRTDGLESERFNLAAGGAVGSTAATMVAGPLGGLAWTVGFDGTLLLLEATGGDEVLRDIGSSIGDGLYATDIPEHDAAWYRNATPAMLAEYEAQIKEAQRIAEQSVPERVLGWAGEAIGGLFR